MLYLFNFAAFLKTLTSVKDKMTKETNWEQQNQETPK